YGAGLVGDDPDGAWILADCASHGINRSQIASCDAPTSYTDVMTVSGDGRRTFFHQRGANALFDGRDVLFVDSPKIFYLGYLLLLDALDQVGTDGSTPATKLLGRASTAACLTAVDLVSDQEGEFRKVVTPALPHTDVLFLNEYEAGRLLDEDFSSCDRDDLLAAADEIKSMGVRRLVVIHRADGAAAVGEGERLWQGSVKVPEDQIAGAVGAGDAFAAGMLFGLHEDLPLTECLRQAVCSAALCLTEPTTSGGMRPMAEALDFGADHGFRL
ncbi:MAG: sugar/nucleoside kinase (ribokinase family), partial [Pseudoalteromonas tetraodonis]